MELKLVDTELELQQILELQKANHYENVSDALKQANGFVTVKHDLATLTLMNEKARQIIAVDENEVVGYALVMVKELKRNVPTLVPMFEKLKTLSFNGTSLQKLNYYIMGQICIAEKSRGKGIFKSLYQKHKEVYSSEFDACITSISTSNPRSIRAHEKIGFSTIHTFYDELDEWNIVLWNWN